MRSRIALTLAVASMMIGGTAIASTSGASFGGTTISADDDDQNRRRNRKERHAQPRNEAATSTTGVAVTTRRGGAAAIDTRGMARGDGTVQSSSEGEVYSSTDRDGSQADAVGSSEASATERRRRRPQ